MLVVWSGVAATIVVALIAAEMVRRALTGQRRQLVEQEAALTRRLVEQESAMVRLAEGLLPEAVAQVQHGESAEDVLSGFSAEPGHSPQFQAARQSIVRAVVEAVQAEEDLRESAQRAMVNIARRVQAIVHQQSQALREMEDRHGANPKVFGDLLQLDHGTALIGRLADSVVFLGGGRPGQQWSEAVKLRSVLRGAMSRILDYRRVQLDSVVEGVAVIGPAVTPVIHALAELLDNATRYSPPHTKVIMSAIEIQNGIAVEIEDSGLGLSEEARERTDRMLRQAQAGINLTDLGETPRLGLAVVGRLSQTYNFGIDLRPSGYGGVRAVLSVPKDLITTAPASGEAHGIGAGPGRRAAKARPSVKNPKSSVTAARSGAPAVTPALEVDDVPAVAERTDKGLPQRRRRNPDRAQPRRAASTEPQPRGDTDGAVQPGMWLADFQSGLTGDNPTTAPARPNSDKSSGKGE